MASYNTSDTIGMIRTAASYFGFNLKQEQESALKEFVGGSDLFVSLPTGYGKSLCYGLLPTVFDTLRNRDKPESIAIVASPLISLMNDQTDAFNRLGVSSACVNQSDKEETSKESKLQVLRGQHQLVFM